VQLELRDLPPKDAFCLACLPAIHQQHVLSLIPTSVPISNALAQLAASAWRGGAVQAGRSSLARCCPSLLHQQLQP
jgi:hypothetical protein